MPRLHIPSRDSSPEASEPILDSIYEKLGRLPNVSRLIGSSPATLEAYTALQAGLSKTLDAKMRQRIAIAVAQVNECEYCLSANHYLARNFARLSPEEIDLNRQFRSKDPRAEAAIKFAARVAEARGHVTDQEVEAVRQAGFDDAQIVEIVALVTESIFANYLNEVAKTDIDFPVVATDVA